MQDKDTSRPSLFRLSKIVTIITGIVFLIGGLQLFLLSAFTAANFAWKITPFTAMTMGAWSLGGAAYAWEGVRHDRWGIEVPSRFYLWAFGILETLVVLRHRDVLRLDAPPGWPYLLMLLLAVIAAALGGIDLLRRRPSVRSQQGAPVPWWVRGMVIAFILLVGFLGILLSLGPARPGRAIFPNELSAFTAHAFGAFYLALVVGILPLLWVRTLQPVLAYMRAGALLILMILISVIAYWNEFDLAARPGGWIYIGAYLIALIGSLLILGYDVWQRRTAGSAVMRSSG